MCWIFLINIVQIVKITLGLWGDTSLPSLWKYLAACLYSSSLEISGGDTYSARCPFSLTESVLEVELKDRCCERGREREMPFSFLCSLLFIPKSSEGSRVLTGKIRCVQIFFLFENWTYYSIFNFWQISSIFLFGSCKKVCVDFDDIVVIVLFIA